MAIAKKFLVFISIALLSISAAPSSRADDFSGWLEQFKQEAIASGLSAASVGAAMDQISPNEEVIALDQKQPEDTITFEEYITKTLSAQRIREGRRLLERHLDILHDASMRYGVPPQIIVALWGMESNFGRNTGGFSVIQSLTTLAYEGRRASFFRKELLAALQILETEHMSSDYLEGSWAGAMGQCQFMPSTYLKHAIDYDGDGHRDIWGNEKDVFASIANYLTIEGWKNNQSWGREVRLTKKISSDKVGLKYTKTLAQWQKLGVRTSNKKPLPNRPMPASLIQPDGFDGRSFLVYDNFRALMWWNASTYFALSVSLLADQISSSQ